MKKAEYKRHDNIAAWDLDKGSRRYINSSTPAHRRLKKILRKQSRKMLDKTLRSWYN